METGFSPLPTSPGVMAVGAPRWPVVASSASAAVAIVCAFLGAEKATAAALGYVLGALLVPALTVMHRFGRRRAGQSPFFVENARIEHLVTTALMVGIGAGVVSAWFVATELAKQ